MDCLECFNPILNNNKMFCCRLCSNRYKSKKIEHNRRKINKICLECLIEFYPIEINSKFCSHSCAATYSNKNRIVTWSTKISKSLLSYNDSIIENRNCLKCGLEFAVSNKSPKKFCSRECVRSVVIHKMNSTSKSILTRKKMSETRKLNIAMGQKITGGYTKWYNYKDIRVQGSYEVRTCRLLDIWKERGVIKDWIYGHSRFKYFDGEGIEHTYVVDFKVINNDNTFYFLETKGYKRENDDYKWKTVRDLGYNLVVWFLPDIIKNEQMHV